jgi:hypothetical protein
MQTQHGYDHPLQVRDTYNGLWQGARGGYSPRTIDDVSPRWGWMPPRCSMLVLFVIGVSVCASSGFALFVEYQKGCPSSGTSIPEGNLDSAGQESSEQAGTQGRGSVLIASPDDRSEATSCEGADYQFKYCHEWVRLCAHAFWFVSTRMHPDAPSRAPANCDSNCTATAMNHPVLQFRR